MDEDEYLDEYSNYDDYDDFDRHNDYYDCGDNEKESSIETSESSEKSILPITPQELGINLLKKLNFLYTKNLLTDFEIKHRHFDNPIKIHKCVLAASCPYIGKLLDNEPGKEVVDFSHLDAEAVKLVLNWFYNGELMVDESNLEGLLECGDFLCLEEVCKHCARFIVSDLTGKNSGFYYLLSSQFKIFDFENKIKIYLIENFVKFLFNTENPIPNKILLKFLEDEELMYTDEWGYLITKETFETKLFEGLTHYIFKHNLSSLWPDILQTGLRYGLMDETTLQKIITFCKNPDNFNFYKQISLEIEKFGEKLKEELTNLPSTHVWLKERSPKIKIKLEKSKKYGWSYDSINQSELETFDDLVDLQQNEVRFVKRIKLFFITWSGVSVLGGMTVFYNNGSQCHHGISNVDEKDFFHDVTLLEGERITSVTLFSGWMIDNISFNTSQNRTLGPFGGTGGGKRILKPKKRKGFLSGFIGKVCVCSGVTVVRLMKLVWTSS